MTSAASSNSAPPTRSLPTAREVGAFFDEWYWFAEMVQGRGRHAGAWPDTTAPAFDDPYDEVSAAQERMVGHLAGVLAPPYGGHVLDAGCGSGHSGLLLAHLTGTRITGCSVSRVEVGAANVRAACAGMTERAHFQYSDVMKLPYEDGEFDAVWAVETLDHVRDPLRALREMRRVLRPGGRALVTTFSRRAELDRDELDLLVQEFCVCPPMTTEDVANVATEAGFSVDYVADVHDELQVGRTWPLWEKAYATVRPALLDECGADEVELIDLFLEAKTGTLSTGKFGYTVAVLTQL
ncbi:class I SAM-dependent methyltransferase [Yinghuangia sp. YIM S09857]|uniref:class I SAM-dependent methyltransferase n=1 Tax=Yinghuangia sp. YIM S09857 TaxID=3436929 RepID=UPI003F53B09E